MANTTLATGIRPASGAATHQVVVHVGVEVLSEDDPDGPCHLEDGPALAAETARRLACDAGLVSILERPDGSPLDVGRRTRAISVPMRAALVAKDQGCRFPGCGARRFVDAHHVVHWAKGGRTDLANLVLLCGRHHRLVHEGGFSLSYDAGADQVTVTRPDGRVVRYVPEHLGADGDLVAQHAALGLDIGPEACMPLWDGSPMDYALAVDALLCLDGRMVIGPRRRAGRSDDEGAGGE